jgi:pimeloyl-ACP methyl ester carboxylesterase
MSTVERTTTRVAGLKSSEMDFQLMRSLGAANYGGGTPGEIFQRLGTIDGDDPYKWPPAFEALGAEVDRQGDNAAKKNHPVSARDAHLRASMYWRAAEYFSDSFSPDMLRRGLACHESFMKAAKLADDKITAVEVPFEGLKLPGLFMTPARKANGRTLVVLTGFDGTSEELYFQTAAAGLERGFNIFIAEGPGQVGAMRLHPNLVFRPDYEKPIGAMIDVALGLPGVDPAKLGLYGISFGGYFVTRGGEHDRRIKALVVNSPIIDLRRYMLGFVGGEAALAKMPPFELKDVDAIPDADFPHAQKLSFKASCRRFGVTSFAGWFERLKAFNAVDALGQITCPTLAMVGAGEGGEAMQQFETYCSHVKGPVTRRLFAVAEGADMHCQVGNLPLSNAVVYDWLEEVL